MIQGSLTSVVRMLEKERESRWDHFARAAQLKLGWRALFIQKYLHLLPGESILEIGAGSGALTSQLDRVLRAQNPIQSIVFSPELLDRARSRCIPNVTFSPADIIPELPSARFDYVLGCGILWHSAFSELLEVISRVLKPGGQMLFFEPNLRFPARVCNGLSERRGATTFNATPEQVVKACARHGLTAIELAPHDIVSCRLGYSVMKALQAKAILLEHTPALKLACGSMYLSARKPGTRIRPVPNLAEHSSLRNSVSVVVPARNEAANIAPLVQGLCAYYGDYIHEIVIVNDSSTDGTAEVAATVAATEPRVRLINRSAPNGVGRALRDGYRAATGKYILSMDCDFFEILPELRGLFDAIARGHAGAIGSRFSHESILINYPFGKMVLNRICHALIKLFLVDHVRDITNNLKLYRADILQNLSIESPHFSANLETGLKPLMAGYDITQVAISWINRTPQMGTSSFQMRKVGYDYTGTLFRCWRGRRTVHSGALQLMLDHALNRLAHLAKH